MRWEKCADNATPGGVCLGCTIVSPLAGFGSGYFSGCTIMSPLAGFGSEGECGVQ